MSLDHTIVTPIRTPVTATGTVLKIQAGAHSTILSDQQVSNNHTQFQNSTHAHFVWNGNVYFLMGSSLSSSIGCWKYNPVTDKLSWSSYASVTNLMIPIFDRIGFLASSDQGWGTSPEDRRVQTGVAGSLAFGDYAINGSGVVVINPGTNTVHQWAYPFTSAITTGPTLPDNTCRRLVELGGDIYTVWIDDVAGEIKLYKLGVGVWSLIGTPSSHSGLADYDPTAGDRMVLFKFNSKLFLVVARTSIGTPMFRLFEINPDGSSTEPSYLPAAWTGAGSGQQRMMVVLDSISPTEQVFLIHYEYGLSGWDCYEFIEGPFGAEEESGTDSLLGGGGVIYDPEAKASQIKSANDSTPSSYVRTEIEVFDLKNNGTVDIDPRYRWNNVEPPPYAQCTGKVPNNTVTGLLSAPVQTVLSDLDDDFADGTIDEELWERVTFAFFDDVRDYGHGMQGLLNVGTLAEENNGAIRFGAASQTYEVDQGVGIKSKSRMSGAFTADFTIADPENLNVLSTTPAYMMIVLVRVAVNIGFGFIVWKTSTGPQIKVRGIYMAANSNVVASADVTTQDADVIRIARDGSDVWSIILDPDGLTTGPVDITPAGGANYADDVEIAMGGKSNSATTWVATGTPAGDEPGIGNLTITGAGSPGLYQGGVKHTFDWDHISDLGAGQTGGAELFVDTQRT